MPAVLRLFAFLLLLTVTAAPLRALAQEAPPAQVAWRLLDYISVDYPGAVQGGRVISAAEYAEMQEFAKTVRARLASLPATPAKAGLLQGADALATEIARKAPPAEVAVRARRLAGELLAAYPTPLAPATTPDLALGARLYAEQCAACHGATGHADGPNAKGLDPAPVAFADPTRARERSLFGLYQVIGQGLDGTAMASFAHLSDTDRWALAFYAGGFAFDADAAQAGEALWKADPNLRARFPNLQAVTQVTPAALAAELGEPRATQLTAFLRRQPSAVTPSGEGSLDVARTKLQQSLAAYQAGDPKRAENLALSAYLDGFEPVEPTLKARDGALMVRIETAMGELRASVSSRAPAADVATKVERLIALLNVAEQALAPERASAASSFAGAFAILLREGLEALLIVVAMIAFLGKADRRDVLPYVHAGWISALAAGAATWAAATWLISISGASRELMEGFGSLVSAAVLVSVGVWMHGKSHAEAWQRYIKEKLSAALSKGSAWFLFGLAFVVVYREVFETILFFAALWAQGGHLALMAGAGVAMVFLAVIARLLLTYSRRLPITQFFAYSALLIAVLAVVLAGKGVAGLQEAGLLDVHPLAGAPRIEMLGVYPTWEGLWAQLATLALLVVGFRIAGRKTATAA